MDGPSGASHRLSDPSTWVAQYGDYLFRNAVLRVRHRDLAEEMVQETFLAALEARGRFAGRSSEKTWLTGILKHKVIDHLRRSSREIPVEDVERLPCEEESPFLETGTWKGHWRSFQAGPADWGGSPSDILERKEFLEVLHACLSGLPPRLARAFVLREVVELSKALEQQGREGRVDGSTPGLMEGLKAAFERACLAFDDECKPSGAAV